MRCQGPLIYSKLIEWSMFKYVLAHLHLQKVCRGKRSSACMLLLPTNTSEVLILYLLYQETGKKYGSTKTFANIESYIYLKMSHERYLAHLCSNKMFLNDGNLIGRQAFLMLVCKKKKICVAVTENCYRTNNCWVICDKIICCGCCDFKYASKQLVSSI